jgi:hypothetical protein
MRYLPMAGVAVSTRPFGMILVVSCSMGVPLVWWLAMLRQLSTAARHTLSSSGRTGTDLFALSGHSG